MEELLQSYGKKLDARQMDQLLSKTDSSIPLYLFSACEELRVFGIHEKVLSHIKSLPDRLDNLLAFVFNRMNQDYGNVNHTLIMI